MTRIQVDIPDELLNRIRKGFEIQNNIHTSKIPIAKSHLVLWYIEQHIDEYSEETLETPKTPETLGRTPSVSDVVSAPRRTHMEISRESPREEERIPSLEEVLDEIDRHAAMNSETVV